MPGPARWGRLLLLCASGGAALVGPLALGARPPVVALVELVAWRPAVAGGQPSSTRVRVAHPKGWNGDLEPDRRSIRLFGPNGEGEMLIAVATHPSELGAFLEDLRASHPGAAPSPPRALTVPGINAEKGERATRFIITGKESGELVTIERGEVIVLFATIVAPAAWAEVAPLVSRCYPTVEVEVGVDRGAKKSP